MTQSTYDWSQESANPPMQKLYARQHAHYYICATVACVVRRWHLQYAWAPCLSAIVYKDPELSAVFTSL